MIEIEMPDSKALEDARQTFAALSHGRALLDDASVFAGEAPPSPRPGSMPMPRHRSPPPMGSWRQRYYGI